MADNTKEEEISHTVSDVPPSHYMVKIQSVSLLAKNNIDKYTSDEFEAGGYKWKLVIHPNGNKSKKITDHISLYITMADTSHLHPGWEVHAVIRLFLYDQKKDNYYVVQDKEEKARRFRAMKMEWGHDKFIPLTTFNNTSNYGYLVDDVCVFGAEVSVRKEIRFPGKDCLTMIKDPEEETISWEIKGSSLKQDCRYVSEAKQYWKIHMYPKGTGNGAGTHVSLYLALANAKPSTQIYAEFTLRIIYQLNQINPPKHALSDKVRCWFNATNAACGWDKFISIGELNKAEECEFVVKETCIVEADIKVLGVADDVISNNIVADCKEIILT